MESQTRHWILELQLQSRKLWSPPLTGHQISPTPTPIPIWGRGRQVESYFLGLRKKNISQEVICRVYKEQEKSPNPLRVCVLGVLGQAEYTSGPNYGQTLQPFL